MERAWAEGGLAWRVLAAWVDLRGSMRAELDREPSEGRLLFYAMLSGAVWSVGEIALLRHSVAVGTLSEAGFMGHASALVAGALFVRTLALYGLAVLAHAVARAVGGQAGWQTSRAALFWAALVSAPAMVAVTLVALVVAGDAGGASGMARSIGSLIFAVVAAAAIAEAHRFAGLWRGAAVVVGMAALVLGFVAVMNWL
jgi:hypothetical protein